MRFGSSVLVVTLAASLVPGTTLRVDVKSFSKAEFYRPVGTETEKLKGSIELESVARPLRFVSEKLGRARAFKAPVGIAP
jgi:hypothetical protein